MAKDKFRTDEPRTVAEPRDGHMVDPQPTPVGVDRPRWKFSHNNAPEIIIEATSQAEAERLGREQTGSLDSPHPVRTWPA